MTSVSETHGNQVVLTSSLVLNHKLDKRQNNESETRVGDNRHHVLSPIPFIKNPDDVVYEALKSHNKSLPSGVLCSEVFARIPDAQTPQKTLQ